ncbi:MAG: fibronectin type III domain-containing protein, partial [Acidimicrobiales bacterium]
MAIIDAFDSPTAAADLATYRSQFGLPACPTSTGCFRKVDQNGGTNFPGTDSGWSVEIALDIEMVSAICPACSILLVEANSPSSDDLGPAVNTAVRMGAAFVSNSYGGSEVAGEDSIDARYFDHPGVVITASSGDAGYGVLFPAASPHVIAVGGTTLSRAANARGWVETAWSGAGSGCSAYEPKPAWQQDTGCPNRTVADVAAVADPATGVALYAASAGGWVVVGGTSAGSPIVAAAYALAGHPAAGTYPAVYPYVRSGSYDVTSGSTGSCGSTYLCTATTGYDGPTGLGTPNGTAPFAPLHLPGAPIAVSAAAGDAQVDVSWSAPASDGGTPITSYLVSASSGNHTCSWASGPLSCVVGGLIDGTAYSFRVTATTVVGTSSASASSPSATPRSVPDPPTTVTATPGDASAYVSWLAPASDGGSAITGYAVTSSPDAKTCATSGAIACTVSGLTNDTPYTFTVTAMNIAGTSLASAPSDSVTPRTPPGSTYHALSPTRLLDTRIGNGLSGTFKSHLARTFQVTGRGGVPATAVAVTGNLTVTGQATAGYLFIGPNP